MEPTRSPANRAIIATAASTGVLALLAVPYLFAAMFSVMLFDAPGSTGNPWVWLAFLAICAYPVMLALSVVAAWVLVARQRYTPAFKVAVTGLVLEILPALLFLLAIAFE